MVTHQIAMKNKMKDALVLIFLGFNLGTYGQSLAMEPLRTATSLGFISVIVAIVLVLYYLVIYGDGVDD